MATVILAIADERLRDACRQHLAGAGHAVIVLERPLEVLTLVQAVHPDLVLVDDGDLGASTAAALDGQAPVLTVGAELQLPLDGDALLAAVDEVASRLGGPRPVRRAGPLTIDRGRRVVAAAGREVSLTPTQMRLFEVLLDSRPGEVSTRNLLRGIWGYEDTAGAEDLVRAHVRNLRNRLAVLGLADCVRSRRGRGYSLVL